MYPGASSPVSTGHHPWLDIVDTRCHRQLEMLCVEGGESPLVQFEAENFQLPSLWIWRRPKRGNFHIRVDLEDRYDSTSAAGIIQPMSVSLEAFYTR